MMRSLRLVLWVAVALAAAGAAFLLLRPAPVPMASSSADAAPVGGPFTLVGVDGQPYSSQRLANRPHVLFFGFTHCPDVCPNTLGRLAALRRALGQGDTSFDIVFVSVDPERDTPAEMKAYAAAFDTPIVALTGSAAQVERVKKQFGIFSEKVPQPDGSYSVDHSAAVLLFDRQGRFTGTITPEEGRDVALAKLKRIAA